MFFCQNFQVFILIMFCHLLFYKQKIEETIQFHIVYILTYSMNIEFTYEKKKKIQKVHIKFTTAALCRPSSTNIVTG